MAVSLSIGPIVAIIAGILILIVPRLLNYIIALYLIIVGILGLVGPDAADTAPAAIHSVTPVGHTTGI